MKKKNLVKVIKDNPGCLARIDNDCWTLEKGDPFPDGFDNWTFAAQESWYEQQVLATDRDVIRLGDGGYGSGNCCGGDILQALARIVGIRIESV